MLARQQQAVTFKTDPKSIGAVAGHFIAVLSGSCPLLPLFSESLVPARLSPDLQWHHTPQVVKNGSLQRPFPKRAGKQGAPGITAMSFQESLLNFKRPDEHSPRVGRFRQMLLSLPRRHFEVAEGGHFHLLWERKREREIWWRMWNYHASIFAEGQIFWLELLLMCFSLCLRRGKSNKNIWIPR